MTQSELPKEFIDKCKEMYPTSKFMHHCLKNGLDDLVGKAIADSYSETIHVGYILAATDLTELQNFAKVLRARKALYRQWQRVHLGGEVEKELIK